MNDWELIQAYCRNGSESAFETLVKRHVDFVYCSALRQVRDPLLAEDVSQAVFLLLVRKARAFRSGTVLVSWLFRTTQFVAARALRTEYRRQRRELEAAAMNPLSSSPETDQPWERIAPILDEALATLPSKDRDAVLLRFFSRKPFGQVGAEIGVSEDAAKKRVTRALARLRQFFTQRGTTLSTAALTAILAERAAQAAPAGIGTKIAAAFGAGASTTSATPAATLVKIALRDLFRTKVKWGLVGGAATVALLFWVNTALRPIQGEQINVDGNTPATFAATTANEQPTPPPGIIPTINRGDRVMSLLVAQAETRTPVPEARVLVECWDGKQMERILDSTTDAQGTLKVPVPTRSFETLQIWVSAAGRVPMFAQWQAHEFSEPVLLHTLFLEEGQLAHGTILDETGNPISGAKVSFRGPGADRVKRESRHFHSELSAAYTGVDGRWTTTQLTPQVPGLGVDIRVTHPDFTPAQPWVGSLPGFPTNAVLILSNGVALSGRVVAADGSPIVEATAAKQSGRAYLSARTDADGRFTWPHIEPGRVFVDVEASGFETIHESVWATNAANEFVFTLTESSNQVQSPSNTPRIWLRGSVVDAEAGTPIPRFRVLIGSDGPFNRSGSEAVLHSPRFLGEGHDGRFDWHAVADGGAFRLQVEAEGYLESISGQRTAETAAEEFEFKLKRGTILTGIVLTAGQLPAEGAAVTLAGGGFGAVMHRPGQMVDPNPGFETTRTRTDRDGRFTLKLKTGARGVAVIHDSGCALLSIAAATNAPVVLPPWGAIEGALFLGGEPAPNQHVSVTGRQKSETDPLLLLSFSYRTTTDDHGRFRFEKVPPGEHAVAREVGFFDTGPSTVNHSHAALVKVESGVTASVELRRHGRPVVGRIVLDGLADDVHWGTSQAYLQVEGTQPPKLDYERAPADSARANFLHRAATRFPAALSRDGSIRADDVPPGSYTLVIELKSAAADPLQFSKLFGSLSKTVTVPSGADEIGPLDVGALTLERAK